MISIWLWCRCRRSCKSSRALSKFWFIAGGPQTQTFCIWSLSGYNSSSIYILSQRLGFYFWSFYPSEYLIVSLKFFRPSFSFMSSKA